MTTPHVRAVSGALALLCGSALAACGGSSHSSTTSPPHAAPVSAKVTPPSTSSPATGTTGNAPSVVIGSFATAQDGTLITGAHHRSLYILQADAKSTAGHAKSSTCYGGCAAVWPPVLSTTIPTVSDKAVQALVGLTKRTDGTEQVTYNGRPLYYYVADRKAGQATGNHLKDGYGFWIGMLPSGKPAPDGAN